MHSVFISSAREDKAARADLEKHLAPLKKQNLIEVWHDGYLLPGDNWQDEVWKHLETADLVLALVSPDYLDSRQCELEFGRALELRSSKSVRVIPIILEYCGWRSMPPIKDGLPAISQLDVTPRDGKPIQDFVNLAQGFEEVRLAIERVFRRSTQYAEEEIAESVRDQITEAISTTKEPSNTPAYRRQLDPLDRVASRLQQARSAEIKARATHQAADIKEAITALARLAEAVITAQQIIVSDLGHTNQ